MTRTLKAAGVGHNEALEVAPAILEEIELFDVLGRPMTLEEVRGLLRAAYG